MMNKSKCETTSLKQFQRDDRVLLTLQTAEIYEGNIADITSRTIEIYNIYCQESQRDIPGNLSFSINEVKNISHIMSNTISSSNNDSANGFDNLVSEVNKIRMHSDEYDRLKNMCNDYVFIDMYNSKFDEAVQSLSDRENVGVVCLGNNFNRKKKMSLLVLTDFKQVYVFDMLCLTRLRGLADIIANEYVTKVVYGADAVFDSLYHKYKLEVPSVFDIQVSERILDPDVRNLNIGESLNHHFKFPLSYCSSALEYLTDELLEVRPLTVSDKKRAALLGTYLITLKDHLMERILEKHINEVSKTYNKVKNMTPIEATLKKLKMQKKL